MVGVDLNLRGQSVTRVCFDAAFTLLTSEDYEVRVEADASIQAPGGDLVVFDPESPGAIAAQLVSLVHDTVTSAEVGSVGGLLISFESGAELVVAPDSDYEAWELVGPNRRRVVCMPGGEIARWSEQQPRERWRASGARDRDRAKDGGHGSGPMNAIIARTLIELLVSLELSDEESVSVEASAALAEDAATSLGALSDTERAELISIITQMGEEAGDEDRQQVLLDLPDGLGLTE
ncbi:hypothetical protein GCM10009576_078320 [Streptomyces rhizosphaericus]|uniref:Uncharacterized protein n=1 Tax=Streptomyces rhizosphaericus TaxID=114699 RepID=A0ABP4D6Z0_9ACTN